ncbi:unnamed protein product, partial [Scytosiphon promiscuus]
MAIRICKVYTVGTRNTVFSSFDEITKTKTENKLSAKNHPKKGQNKQGLITTRHHGGGNKRRY